MFVMMIDTLARGHSVSVDFVRALVRDEKQREAGRATAVEATPGDLLGEEWAAFLFLRKNVKGPHAERWRHIHGCARFFNAVRDTVTDKFLMTYKAGEPKPELSTLLAHNSRVCYPAIDEYVERSYEENHEKTDRISHNLYIRLDRIRLLSAGQDQAPQSSSLSRVQTRRRKDH